MKYRVELTQKHVVYVHADDDFEAEAKVLKMNDVEIAKTETYKGDMEIESIEEV